MVVGYFHFKGVAVVPQKADTPLVIYSYAVPTRPTIL